MELSMKINTARLKTLAIIPARSGSKGLPGKNIMDFCGKPLIAWTIEQALGCDKIDKVVVSTEDKEIATISKKYGAEICIRPTELAQDNSMVMDAIFYTLDHLDEKYDIIVLLEATKPMREISDIETAIEVIKKGQADAVVGVTRLENMHPNNICYTENGLIKKYFTNDFSVKNRQELKDLYYYEGTIYASRVSVLRERRNFYHENTWAHVVPSQKAIEIDHQSDLISAEALFRHYYPNRTT